MAYATPPRDENSSSADYSAAATVILFPRPLPLLRTPLPNSSTFLLAFPSPSSFSLSLLSARRTLVSQCESGARIACALSASSLCQPPFWHPSPSDFTERALCEDRESSACFRLATDRCIAFSHDKCLRGFRDAWVGGERKVDWREAGMVGLYLCAGRDFGFKRFGSWPDVKQRCFLTTCCTGSHLLLSDSHGFF